MKCKGQRSGKSFKINEQLFLNSWILIEKKFLVKYQGYQTEIPGCICIQFQAILIDR